MTTLLRRFYWPVGPAIGVALLLLMLGVLLAHYEDALYMRQQQSNVTDLAEILAASVSAALEFDDAKTAQDYVDALKVNQSVLAASVYDQNRAIATFVRAGTAPPPRTAPPPGITMAEDTIHATVGVGQAASRIGAVTLYVAGEPLQRRLARYLGLLFLAAMGALVIAVLAISQGTLVTRARQLSEVNSRLQDEMAKRARTEDALRQSQKMEAIGQLSGGIAHDFNNLIMIAKGSLRSLRRKAGASEHVRYLDAAESALDRATGLTQRILAFSRRQPLTPQAVDLSALIAGMDDLLRHSVGEKVTIDARLKARWKTLCDVNQMENVILNLAINARDAMPEGGTLTVETSDMVLSHAPPDLEDFQPGAYVCLTMRDTGHGMSEEVRSRALDPFFTTKAQGKGTGLGLSTSFGFVRQSGGYLGIDSAPGRGTAITIYMPKLPGAEP
jgi:signal transduction histidine kinase